MKCLRMLVMAPWLAACGIEFSEPQVETPAGFSVGVELTDSLGHGEVLVSAALALGYSADGTERTVEDPSFRILGRAMGPSQTSESDAQWAFRYLEAWEVDPDVPPGPVEVQAPVIGGLDDAVPVLRLTPPWRTGPADVSVAPGASLRLELTTVPGPADSMYQHWRLELVKDGRSVAQMSASGPVPPTVEVPWAMLAGLADGGEARLRVYQGVTTLSPGRRYRGNLYVIGSHVWFVTVEP